MGERTLAVRLLRDYVGGPGSKKKNGRPKGWRQAVLEELSEVNMTIGKEIPKD